MNETVAWCLFIIFAAIIIAALVTVWDDHQPKQ